MVKPVVKPIIITKVDWLPIIELFSEHLGSSPARILDSSNIKLTDLMSLTFLVNTLKDSNFDPKKDSIQPHSLTHTSMGFIAYCDYYTILEVSEISTLSISFRMIDQIMCLSILSGSLDKWIEAIIQGCTPSMKKETRLLLNQCFVYFNNTSIGKLFSSYTRHKLTDGTITFEA